MEWFKHYFDFINDEGIQAVSFINCNWDSYAMFKNMSWGDERIENDPEIRTYWKNEIKEGYINYSLNLF